MPRGQQLGMSVARRAMTVAAVLVVLGALLLGACGGADTASVSAPPRPTGEAEGDATLLAGRRVYAKHCASCHGIGGEGAPAPAFVGGRLLRVLPDAADELALLRDGRAVMPSFGETLTDAQLDAVVRYTREVLSPLPDND